MKKMKLVLFWASLILLTHCSSDNSNPDTSPNITTVTGALTNIASKIEATVPDTSAIAPSSFNTRAAMTEWTTTGSQHSLGGDFGASPRDYVRNQGDEDVQGSLMYRLNQVMDNLCVFAAALPSTNGVPNLTTSATTITLTSTLKSNIVSACGVDVNELPADGTEVGYLVEDISDVSGSQYDRKISFDMAGGSSFHNFFYMTLTTSMTRMSFLEASTNDSVAFFEYIPADGLFKFEFSENATAPFRVHYRGILNETSNLGRFVAWSTNNTDSSIAVVSVLEGAGDQLHASYSFDDDANMDDFTDGSACLDSTDLSVETDNDESCGDISGVLASAFTVDLETGVDAGSVYILARDETHIIQFNTLANILTAGLAD